MDLTPHFARLFGRAFSSPKSSFPRRAASVPQEVLEAIGRHFGIARGVLNVLVAEVVLQCPCVVAVVGELVAAGVAQHVLMQGLLTEPKVT